jgi:hypothetical protein
VLVDLGIEGTRQRAEVEQLFSEVFVGVGSWNGELNLVAEAGRLSDLFAPSTPPVAHLRSMVIWTVSQGSFSGFVEQPDTFQSLLRRFHQLATGTRAGPQYLYLCHPDWKNIPALVPLLLGLGIEVRVPDPSGGVLMEVVRPDGTILSALLGVQLSSERPSDYAAVYNQKKDAALASNDRAELAHIEAIERQRYAPFFQHAQVAAPPLSAPAMRDSRLRLLTLRVQQKPDDAAARAMLFEALLAHERPLLLICDLQKQIPPMRWGELTAIPVFCDLLSVQLTARQTGAERAGYGIVEMRVPELVRWLLEMGVQAALSAFRDVSSPQYTLISARALRALAEGRVPSEHERK